MTFTKDLWTLEDAYNTVCDLFVENEIILKFGDDIFEGLNKEEKEETIDASLKLMGKTRDQILNENRSAVFDSFKNCTIYYSEWWKNDYEYDYEDF